MEAFLQTPPKLISRDTSISLGRSAPLSSSKTNLQVRPLLLISDISKGYGFINCENKKTYDRILTTKNHMIKGRLVEINQAIKRNGEVPEDLKTKSLKKLFIGGLPPEATRDDLVEYFSNFGEVANAYVIYDPITRESKCRL